MKRPFSALILAAGRSSRMKGENKLLLPLAGIPVIEHVVRCLCASSAGDIVVVTGDETDAVRRLLQGYSVRVVTNADPDAGLASSISAGILAAGASSQGYMVCLADMPLVLPATIDRLAARLFSAPLPSIVLPVFQGRRGHPVLFDRTFREDLLRLEGDQGGRPILLNHPQRVIETDVEDAGVVIDIDTPEALEAARERLASTPR